MGKPKWRAHGRQVWMRRDSMFWSPTDGRRDADGDYWTLYRRCVTKRGAQRLAARLNDPPTNVVPWEAAGEKSRQHC